MWCTTREWVLMSMSCWGGSSHVCGWVLHACVTACCCAHEHGGRLGGWSRLCRTRVVVRVVWLSRAGRPAVVALHEGEGCLLVLVLVVVLLLLLPLPRKHNLSLLPVEVLILGVLPCALRLRSCCPCGGRGLHGSLTLLFLNLLLKRAQLLGCTLFPLQLLLILLLQGAGGRGRASWRWGHSCCPIPFARGLIFGSSSSFAPCSLFIC
mmetsp:Transcript_24644/g.67164  ORF Transcript_24644/g.67164 Transcript_24644/m.67164 type:complete len:208 (+) Transcript_24644:279-902(+)